MISTYFYLFLIFLLAPLSHSAQVTCPFYADQCKCTQDDPSDSQTFSTVLCESVILAKTTFTTPLRAYRVTGWMRITGDVSTALPDHFGAFQTIYELDMQQTMGEEPMTQNWQPHTFQGVRITSLKIQGLGNLLPDPDLSPLQRLTIRQSSPIRITDDMAKNFFALTSLSIGQTTVSIDDTALASLNEKFDMLALTEASMTEIPAKALSSLKNLKTLHLDGNKIDQIPADAFSKLANLENVYLAGNPVSSIDKSAFIPLTSLVHLDMSATELTSLDLSMFAFDRKTWAVLSLRFDSSKSLKSLVVSGDPSELPDDIMITIKDSALETIDPKVGDILEQKSIALLDIENNENLQCDKNLKWMAPLLTCTLKLMTDNVKCGSPDQYKGRPLGDFISDIDPDSQCGTGEPPTTTLSSPVTKKASGPITASITLSLVVSVTCLFLGRERE